MDRLATARSVPGKVAGRAAAMLMGEKAVGRRARRGVD